MNEQFGQVAASLRDTVYPAAQQFLPRLVAAAAMLIVTWLAARLGRWVAARAARAEWLERLLLRSGILSGLVEPSLSEPRRLVAGSIYWCILIAGAGAALAILSDRIATRLGTFILVLLPNVLLAAAIIIAALWLGRYWSRSVLIWLTNEGMPSPWRGAALVRISVTAAGLALASEATGFATTLIRSAFLILLAGVTFAAANAASPILKGQLSAFLDRKARQPQNEHLLR